MVIVSGGRRAPALLFTHLSGHLFSAHVPVCVHVISIPKDDLFSKLLRLLKLVKREAAMWRCVYGLDNVENSRRQGTGGRDAGGPHGLLRGSAFTDGYFTRPSSNVLVACDGIVSHGADAVSPSVA